MMTRLFPIMILLSFLLTACQDRKLPVFGDGQHRIADFRFQDQDSNWISNETFKDKIYIADFFFTTCPTICPIMSKNLLKVSAHFKGNPHVGILSHSIDPKHDSIPILKRYAEKLKADTLMWHFITGPGKDIYHLAETSYFSAAGEEAEAPGGYMHSGGFVLVDKERRIRGIYDGTSDEEVEWLISDIAQLLSENKEQ